MAWKRDTPEQVVNLLRQTEVAAANGKQTEQASRILAETETSRGLTSDLAQENWALQAPRQSQPFG